MSLPPERTSKERGDSSTTRPGRGRQSSGSQTDDQKQAQKQALDQRDAGEDRDYEGVGEARRGLGARSSPQPAAAAADEGDDSQKTPDDD